MTTPIGAHLSPLKKDLSLYSRVADALRTGIITGQFAPGQKLNERELCEMLEISRPLLREAFKILESEGLVNSVPHRGVFVTVITKSDIEEIYQARAALEALLAENFAGAARPQDIISLRSIVDELRSPVTEGDPSALLAAKNHFYDVLMAGPGNALIAGFLRQLNNRVTMMRRLSLSRPGRLRETVAELDAIIDAIEEHNGELAGKLCKLHVENAARIVLDNIPETTAEVNDAKFGS